MTHAHSDRIAFLCLAFMSLAAASSTGPTAGQPALSAGPVLEQQLTVGDITISYPTGLESQAKELAAVCQRMIPPRKAKVLSAERSFSDHKAIAARVADLLGCPEHAELASAVLSAPGSSIEAFLLPMFSDVRIYREADLKTSGGVNAGLVRLTYDAKTDKFSLEVGLQISTEMPRPPDERCFLPLVVKDDGTFRTRGSLGEHISGILEDLAVRPAVTMRGAMIHEAAEVILAGLGLSHPFARWFNEGVASWAELQIVAVLAPEFVTLCQETCLPRPEHSPLREKINLLAWPQTTYESGWASAEEIEIRQAQYHYATELIDRLLRDQPAGTLAKVVQRLKGACSPDSDAICQAWREVTGTDAKAVLLKYVPERIREGLKQGLPRHSAEEGYKALVAGDFWLAIKHLSSALERNPCDAEAHLNLAIALRKAPRPEGPRPAKSEDGRWLESERHIAIAAALTKCDTSRKFTVHGTVDDEALYALGRAEQIRGRTKEAKEILSRLPKDHEDAQLALKEIEDEEKAR